MNVVPSKCNEGFRRHCCLGVRVYERQTLRFGPFQLDARSGQVRKDGVGLKLQGQPIQILELLLEHPGELVTREELRQLLWPSDTFVDFDHSLNTAIKKLRQALDDDPTIPRYIETIPKRGYRFIGDVDRQQPLEPGHQQSAPAPLWRRLRILLHRHYVVAAAIALLLVIAIYAYTAARVRRGAPLLSVKNGRAAHELYLGGMKDLDRWDKAGKIDTAISRFGQAIVADPKFALAFSALCEAYWAKYRIDHNLEWVKEAETNCRRAAELSTRLPAVYVTLSRLHNGQGEHDLALQEIQQALELEPRDPDALLGKASIYASMGRIDEAEAIYKNAAALRPQHWGAYYELGGFYYRQRRFADAAAQFEKVLEITPDNAMVHATLGAMLQLLKDDAQAEKHLKQAIEFQPSYAAYTNLGALYYTQKRWSESAAMTLRALQINDTDWRAWSNLGLAYEWLGQVPEADEAYRQELVRVERIADVNADDTEAGAEVGMLYARQKQRNKAIERIEAALARAPDDPTILANAAECYEYLGDRSSALAFVKKALAKGFTFSELENNPGNRQLLLDPRFQTIAKQFRTNRNPVQQRP